MGNKNIVIIGNGVSGITAARHIRKMSDHRIRVISDETDHFFSRTALMYVFMGHMEYQDIKPYEDWFWEKNDIELIRGWVNAIDTENKQLTLADEKKVYYDILILGLGSSYNTAGWPGEDLKGAQGLYSYQDLELMENNTQGIDHGVIIGGGLIGVEMAEMLKSRNIDVTFLLRESHYWGKVLPPEEGSVISRHIKDHGVDLRSETQLKAIKDDGSGRVGAVETDHGEEIPCQFVGLTIGVHPKIQMVKGTNIETNKGVLVDQYFRTNIPDVYAIGDCAEFRDPPGRRPPIEQVWYTGKIHGEILAHSICKELTEYTPGNWFNSAKFFDIEYQTYGWVLPEKRSNEEHFFWESPKGDKSFRIVWDKDSEAVLAFNLLGIRFRHEVCDKWIHEGTPVDEVMENLPMANFDPEFFRKHEKDILKEFNARTGKNLRIKAKKGLFGNILQRIGG